MVYFREEIYKVWKKARRKRIVIIKIVLKSVETNK